MAEFSPTLFVKQHCPFCLKVRIAILEAGIGDAIEIREFSPGSENEGAIKGELADHFEKVTFPTARLAESEYLNDSDLIIDRLLSPAGIERTALPVLESYVNGAFKGMMELYRENMELKKKLA